MKRKLFKLSFLLLAVSVFSCKDQETVESEGTPYDASKPIALDTFYPEEGGMATRLIIKGNNFGNDPNAVRVWYNNRKASVVGANGDHLYVVTPRQPGDTVQISIAVGQDSVTFEKRFIYHTSTTVTTIAGRKGSGEFKPGTLSTATFGQPQRLAVDDEGNIYGGHRSGDIMFMLNEANDVVMQLPNVTGRSGAPAIDVTGRLITFPDDNGDGYWVFDKDLSWAGRRRLILHPTDEQVAAGMKQFPTLSYKTGFATSQVDGQIYTWDYNLGILVKFDPRTRVGQEVARFPQVAGSHGMLLFHPVEKHMLYVALIQRNAFYTYNTETGEFLPYAGTAGVNGWRDGEKMDAQFGDIGQFVFDVDNNIVLSDAGNHCIRQITPDGQVSTIIGKPRQAGYVDGNPLDAMFNNPRGVCIDKEYNIYISDTNNNCIRKLAIQ